jgi:Tfp pilus assembly protein PilF
MRHFLFACLLVSAACNRPKPPPPPDDQFIVNNNPQPTNNDASALTGEAKQKMKDGEIAFEEGDYGKAAKLFEEVKALAPKNASVCFNLGLTYQYAGEMDKAAASFEEATRRKPDFAEAYNGWGAILVEMDQATRGIPHLEKAIELNSKYFEAFYNLGEAYRAIEDLEKAKDSYIKAAKLSPADADTQASIGGIFLIQKDYQSAKEYLAKAVELSKQDPQFVLMYGQALEEGGDIAGAEKAYQSAIPKAEKMGASDEYYLGLAAQGCYLLGTLRINKNDLVGAEESMKKWVELSPNSPASHGSLAIVYVKAKKYKEAEASFQKALSIKPGAIGPSIGLGEMYLEQKKCADAKKVLTPILPKIEDKDKKAELEKKIAACK